MATQKSICGIHFFVFLAAALGVCSATRVLLTVPEIAGHIPVAGGGYGGGGGTGGGVGYAAVAGYGSGAGEGKGGGEGYGGAATGRWRWRWRWWWRWKCCLLWPRGSACWRIWWGGEGKVPGADTAEVDILEVAEVVKVAVEVEALPLVREAPAMGAVKEEVREVGMELEEVATEMVEAVEAEVQVQGEHTLVDMGEVKELAVVQVAQLVALPEVEVALVGEQAEHMAKPEHLVTEVGQVEAKVVAMFHEGSVHKTEAQCMQSSKTIL